jgi:methylmalonyl-CoA mutase cobalamin-binding domain/chain
LDSLIEGIVNLEHEFVLEEVAKRIQEGTSPVTVLDTCREGMSLVGDRFQTGEYYLSELMLSASIFNAAMDVLEPALLKERPAEAVGTVVLATLKGDIHDLGKNIFASLLTAHGFEVHDLGVDVDPEDLVAKVVEVKPDFVGLSALITTVFEPMKAAADILEKEGLRSSFKLMVGGGVTTSMIQDHLGADFQTTNAMDGVAYCMEIVKGVKA